MKERFDAGRGCAHSATGCACHSQAVLDAYERILKGLSRRTVLEGIGASFALAGLGALAGDNYLGRLTTTILAG